MEKLLELLNEYWKQKEGVYRIEYKTENLTKREKALFCSKYWWWIKWLLDNNKIDKNKIDSRLVRYIENHFDEDWYWIESSYEDYPIYERLLMLLAIQDEPIEFLFSILK